MPRTKKGWPLAGARPVASGELAIPSNRRDGANRESRPSEEYRKCRPSSLFATEAYPGKVERRQWTVAGVDIHSTEFVGRQRVTHSAQYRVLVRALGKERQVLRKSNARDVGVDGIEFTAKLGGRIGLGIKGIDVRWAAAEVDHDARFGLGRRDFLRGGEPQDSLKA